MNKITTENSLLALFYALPYISSMDILRKNLIFLFDSFQTNPHAAAEKIGVPQPTIHRLLSSTSYSPSASTLQKLTNFFGVTVDEILNKDLSKSTEHILAEQIAEAPKIKGLVPLLTTVQAGEWCEIKDAFSKEDAKTWLPCPVNHSAETFCLIVEGESMKNSGSKPSYEPGDIIFVDPNKAPRPGDRVVAVVEGQTAATFKQYLEEDGKKFLKALNPEWTPRYTTIEKGTTVCGVVIGKWVPE